MKTVRFLHLADLHIGKKLGEYSLIDDQRAVLEQAAELAGHCDEVLIAGDVYDKPAPGTEAMELFDEFLTKLCRMQKPVSIISGNHDAAARISYLGKLLQSNHVTVSEKFNGKLQAVKNPDEEIQIYLLPFVTPVRVKQFWPDEKIENYEDAIRVILKHSELNPEKINILLCHQFITGGEISDEEFSVGGLDNISAEVFADFDYVALGHLHKPQFCGRETVHYAGSPLKYSLSEEHQKKYFTVVEISGKHNIQIQKFQIKPVHDVRTVKGSFAELQKMPYTWDYTNVILTDETPVPDARLLLRTNFPHMLKFSIQNSKIRTDDFVSASELPEKLPPTEMFRLFYQHQNCNAEPTPEQMKIVREIFAELEEEDF